MSRIDPGLFITAQIALMAANEQIEALESKVAALQDALRPVLHAPGYMDKHDAVCIFCRSLVYNRGLDRLRHASTCPVLRREELLS